MPPLYTSTTSFTTKQPTTAGCRQNQSKIPNNTIQPPFQDTGQPRPSKLRKIVSLTSRSWKSFQQRSLANDERYHLGNLLCINKKKRKPPPPYPDPDIMPPVHESPISTMLSLPQPRLASLPRLVPPLSNTARLIPTRPGDRPIVQSAWYFHVHLPSEQERPSQQQQQPRVDTQDPRHRRPVPNYFVTPYRPYRRIAPEIRVHPPQDDGRKAL
ncbi:hypothetical protein TARUN_6144 [Trichoderma arundinaceum]|uniref:Uncharacterized protein n=1 Tax=Trichoderma arundinaceum TaxID=490622 RepID=A0A395NJ31_TRIAR|nr:hypothetical protein TARUN_6144 [Trichoderma arundinaceum]